MFNHLLARTVTAGLLALVGMSVGCDSPSGPSASLPGPPAIIPGSIILTAGWAIVGTSVSFESKGATDTGGNPLTFNWDFGDGGTSAGAATTHAYATEGNFIATVTVSNGNGKKATATVPVAVRNLTGGWFGTFSTPHPFLGGHVNVSITQNGFSLTGTYRDDSGSGTVAGTISATGTVTFTVTVPDIDTFTFAGTAGLDDLTLDGTVNGSGYIDGMWTMRKF